MSYKWVGLKNQWNASSSELRKRDKNQDRKREHSAILGLPAEILNNIAQYLSVKELLNCSATCTRLRAVFNDNFIWRRFCRQHITDYIKSNKNKNEIDYDISTLTNDLDPICEERIHYIEQNQLLNNWKNGKYFENEIHSPVGLYYMSLKSGTPIIYKDIYLFLYDFYRNTITVWNIRNAPFMYTKVRLLYENYFYDELYYEVVGKKLVVFEVGKLIQIYDINFPNKELPLVSLIIFNQDEPLEKIPAFNNPEEMYTLCYHKIFENKIYSHKVGKPVVHIWNLDTGRKVEALTPPRKGINFSVFSAANKGNDLILCLEINDYERQFNALGKLYEILSYSFSQDRFQNIWSNEKAWSTYIPFHAIQHKDLVIVFCRVHSLFEEDTSLPKTFLVLYSCKWEMIIGEKSFPELVGCQQSKVENNQLLLATAFCLYILDITTQEVTYSFKFDNGKIELLNMFEGKFFITVPKSLVTTSKIKQKEVWDVKNRRRAMLLTYAFSSAFSKDSIFVNQSFTKMVIVGKGTLAVLNFW